MRASLRFSIPIYQNIRLWFEPSFKNMDIHARIEMQFNIAREENRQTEYRVWIRGLRAGETFGK